MCIGIAIIAKERGAKIDVYCDPTIHSHDELRVKIKQDEHERGLTAYGAEWEFEFTYPCALNEDITNAERIYNEGSVDELEANRAPHNIYSAIFKHLAEVDILPFYVKDMNMIDAIMEKHRGMTDFFTGADLTIVKASEHENDDYDEDDSYSVRYVYEIGTVPLEIDSEKLKYLYSVTGNDAELVVSGPYMFSLEQSNIGAIKADDTLLKLNHSNVRTVNSRNLILNYANIEYVNASGKVEGYTNNVHTLKCDAIEMSRTNIYSLRAMGNIVLTECSVMHMDIGPNVTSIEMRGCALSQIVMNLLKRAKEQRGDELTIVIEA